MTAEETAARLRERVKRCVHLAYGEADINAALDTLIQYHRQAGAVEALEAVRCRWAGMYDAERKCDPNGRYICDRCRSLAAAQARLAAYEEKR